MSCFSAFQHISGWIMNPTDHDEFGWSIVVCATSCWSSLSHIPILGWAGTRCSMDKTMNMAISHRIHACYIWWHLPSIYPSHVSIYIPYMDPMGMDHNQQKMTFLGDHQTYPKHPAFGMPFLDKWDRCSCNQPLSPTPLRWPWQPHDSWVEILPIPIYIDLIFWLKCKCVTNVLAKNHHKIVICNPFSCFNHHESSNFLEYLTFLPAIFLKYHNIS